MTKSRLSVNTVKSLFFSGLLITAAQAMLCWANLPAPTFYGQPLLHQKIDAMLRRHREAPLDVVFIGYSHVAQGIDVEQYEKQTGLRAYNFAFPGVGMQFQSKMVRDLILPRIQPRAVVWHMDEMNVSRFRISRTMVRSEALAIQRWPAGCYLAPLLADCFPFQKRSIADWFVALLDPLDQRYDQRGCDLRVARYDRKKQNLPDPKAAAWDQKVSRWKFPITSVFPRPKLSMYVTVDPAQEQLAWHEFEETLAKADEHGVEVIGFSAPLNRDVFQPSYFLAQAIVEGQCDENFDRYARLFSKYGVRYANFRYLAPISDRDDWFHDQQHLNRNGANQFVRRAAAFLTPQGPPATQPYQGMPSRSVSQILDHLRKTAEEPEDE